MIFAKTKKKEEELEKIRFIEWTLRSFSKDIKEIDEYDMLEKKKKEKIDIMIEIRALEIYENI